MTRFIILFSVVLACVIYYSCRNSQRGDRHEHTHEHNQTGDGSHDHNGANKHMHKSSFDDLVNRFESKERDDYQKPDQVLKLLGELTNKKVMEIGAGTGYFSFRLVEAGARVIAADVDERFLAYMKEKKDSLQLSNAQLELRQVPYDSPQLLEGEVDMVLVVNTYHHIDKRSEYFNKVLDGLNDEGVLVIIDFFKKDIPIGPPVKMKFSEQEVQKELKKAGFNRFVTDSELLEYQYIISAYKS